MKAKRTDFLWLAFLAAGTAQGALLEDTVSGANVTASGHTLVFSRRDDLDPSAANQNVLTHETNLRGAYRQYSLGVAFTSQLPLSATSGDRKPFTLEKKYAAADWENWKLTVGDSYQELGKGLALSLYRDPVFGIDNTLEGASLKYSGGSLKGGIFGGRVNALRVPVALNAVTNPVLDRQVLLAGSEVKAKASADVTVGGHYLFAAERPDTLGTIDRRWHTVGASLARTGTTDGIDAYLESDILLTQRVGRDGTESLPTGMGTYGSVSWVPAPWKFRLEGKDYRDYRFEFRRPPTLEEDIVETVNTQDVSAGKLSAEYRFIEAGAFTKVSYLAGRDRQKNSPIHHGVLGGGFKGPARTAWELQAGYRSLPGVSDLTHAMVKTKLPTFENQSVEMIVRRQLTRTDLTGIITRDDKQIFDLTYNFSAKFNVGAGMEIVPTNADDLGKHFLNASATVKMGNFAAKAFLGKTSGGTLCSGGVCRQVPPFSGGSLESTYSF